MPREKFCISLRFNQNTRRLLARGCNHCRDFANARTDNRSARLQCLDDGKGKGFATIASRQDSNVAQPVKSMDAGLITEESNVRISAMDLAMAVGFGTAATKKKMHSALRMIRAKPAEGRNRRAPSLLLDAAGNQGEDHSIRSDTKLAAVLRKGQWVNRDGIRKLDESFSRYP